MEPTSEVAALNTRLEAELVVAQLSEAGIDAFIVADNAGGTFPMMQMVTGGYKVMVLTAVADDATEVLTPDVSELPRADETSSRPLDPLLDLTPLQLLGLALALLLILMPLGAFVVRELLF